ncbi:MAG: Uma2 family endonuclease [Acidobacteria bacterium]|nr:Uma2 family endonuclease [Acidobacteriota bacterium]
MATAPLLRFTEAQYLRYEREFQQKHEFVHGNILAMAGAGTRHNIIAANLLSALVVGLRGKRCRAVGSDQRVRVQPGALYFYPDVTVLCPPVEHLDETQDTVLNPHFIAEVLSSATRRHDQDLKLPAYREHPTIQEILLIEPDVLWVQQWFRSPSGEWQMRTISSASATVSLGSLGVEVPISEIYLNAADG